MNQAELSLREMGRVGLLDALDYVALLVVERSERFEPAVVRWLSVLVSECGWLSLTDATQSELLAPPSVSARTVPEPPQAVPLRD